MSKEDFLESLSKYDTFDSITHLNISRKNLYKIKVLPKNLVILDCRYNNLKVLFHKDCIIPETLTTIYCSHNKLKYLFQRNGNVEQSFKNLTILDCSHNQLSSVKALQNLPKLKVLNCSYNQIEKIDYPINIEEIYMNNNLISGKLEFQDSLKIINADNNLITSFTYKELPSLLIKLYLNSNKIEDLDIPGIIDYSRFMECENNIFNKEFYLVPRSLTGDYCFRVKNK